MKTKLIFSVLVLSGLFLIYFLIAENKSSQDINKKASNNGPVIKLKKHKIDLGKVMKHSPLKYEISVFNEGDKPLIITNVRTNCGCTVASYENTPIVPGDSGTVTLKLDTETLGTFNKVAAIYSNAVNNVDTAINSSRVLFHVKWEVTREKR